MDKTTEISGVWAKSQQMRQTGIRLSEKQRTPGQKEGRHNGSLKSKGSSLELERLLEPREQDNRKEKNRRHC